MEHTTHTGIEFEFYHMKISSSAVEVAARSSHPSLLFLDQALPALCECDSKDCPSCHLLQQTTVLTDAVESTTRGSIAAQQTAHVGQVCQCSCHESNHVEQQLTHTHIVILSVISQLEHDTLYGALPSEVHDRVSHIIDLTCVEYEQAVCWLFEEFCIISPLDDGRLHVTQLGCT
ncbi:hypothetical protein F4604DRAFT_1937503 [Suillus subluteus]|nr:hypothetical protein F4604DRAFT_1937503 [Suillus subluteus]